MDCSQAVLTLFLLVPCEQGGGYSGDPTMDLAIAEALASPERIATDRLQDPLRRPDLVLQFFEIRPGMTVLDLFSGGGYHTEIVSRVVGDQGKVVAHNNLAYLAFARDSLAGRYDGERLGNVERVTVEANALELPAGTFDAALALLTWHDFYHVDEDNGWPAIDAAAMVRKLCAALKPGAVLGVTDHVAAAGSEPAETAQTLHRIDPQRIKDDLVGDCFVFEGEISALRNSADDHTRSVFAEDIRGRTDQVVYKFRRNSAP